MRIIELAELFEPMLDGAVFHFEAWNKPNKYIVWAEDSQSGGTYGDNHMHNQVIAGTLDLFTKDEFDPVFDNIQSVLNSSDLAWRLESTQFEQDTGYIHHEWVWEVTNHIGLH